MMIFVADTGADDAAGSAEAPLATLAEALRRVAHGGTIRLRGTHALPEPLLVGPEHGPLTIEAWDADAPPVIRGARRVPAGDAIDDEALPIAEAARGRLREVMLAPGAMPASVTCGGQPLRLARWPKTDRWEEWPLCAPGDEEKRLIVPLELQRAHANPRDIIYNILSTPYTKWINYRGRVTEVDGERVSIDCHLVPTSFLTPTAQIPFRIENALEALTEPGEWCVDTAAGRLWYWPPDAQAEDDFEVALTPTLLRLAGTPDQPVQGVTLSNLTLTLTGGDPADAAVELEHAHDCLVEGCRLQALGGAGIRIRGQSCRDTVIGCQIRDCGGAGIVAVGERLSALPRLGQHDFCANAIERCGQVDWHAAAISLGGVSHCLVREHVIRDMPYAGISIGGTRLIFLRTGSVHGDLPLPCSARELAEHDIVSFKRYVPGYNIVEDNHIEDVMRQLDDGGAIYCHASHHTIVRRNFVRRTLRGNSFGLYFDDDEVESLMEDNVVVDAPGVPGHGSSIHIHDNARNVIRRNYVFRSRRAFTMPRSYGGHQVYHNAFHLLADATAPTPPERNHGRYEETAWDAGPPTCDCNTWWSDDDGQRAREILADLQARGYERHSQATPLPHEPPASRA